MNIEMERLALGDVPVIQMGRSKDKRPRQVRQPAWAHATRSRGKDEAVVATTFVRAPGSIATRRGTGKLAETHAKRAPQDVGRLSRGKIQRLPSAKLKAPGE